MSIGLLIITHNQIGEALLDTAVTMIGGTPLQTRTVAVTLNSNPEQTAEYARKMLGELDHGEGVLILTDMFGSTPSNIASSLLDRPHIMLVTGINLPMLIRVLNYSHLGLAELAQKATSGGHDGIIWSSSR
ncbi:MAG TPA: PTS fructose transporter subunit IIA [Gammaproteobacteria bacterium]|nr:PTS fructose transporter subunit IIA [Gammaproteobacteria bacterium]